MTLRSVAVEQYTGFGEKVRYIAGQVSYVLTSYFTIGVRFG